MSETVRLVCPSGRKHAELWGGYLLAALGVVAIAVDPSHWANITLGVLLLLIGGGLAAHGHLFVKAPVLEVSDGEFHYRRGKYEVSVPFGDIGSYHLLPGGVRSLGLCDTAGRPKRFPSLQSRRTSRAYLPLTGITSPAKVEAFMAVAGIPPRKRSLTS
ncbi:hypothetical protein ACOQFV_02805 [Nocardiopsis changdeensis]|uniref:PH domain-containing protein n=1 Tax=Nocardiopsis changdeensis TaxID=2831969 RepID=A0ABX8BMM0_9ACTN|nr:MULTISPECIES: hypothetical protein [Nocardiopsis]QUX22559.1 hypothetical protein KGD84_30380 [Nocardiopsis changdeensis]QYX38500.1 hypothetical protein K1J57_07760 [Nocardiopsis sp. MT53]